MQKQFRIQKLAEKISANKPSRHPIRFLRSENGAMTILALVLIMGIFAAAGIAVDVMRFDRERARLQYALDRAVLAAADLDQELCPRDVIVDFFEKDGLLRYLDVSSIDVQPDTCGSTAATLEGYRRVQATARMDVETHFLNFRGFTGIDYIPTVATSVAEESIGDVEISMVLDVSGSMGRYSRLTNLKVAAQRFVDEMVEKTEDGKLSISIIPYSNQVRLPDYLMNELNTQGENPHANCIDFPESDFSIAAFDETVALPRTLHYPIPWNINYIDDDVRNSGDILDNEACIRKTATNSNVITVAQKDATALKAHIQGLQAGGNTSMDIGMKWGLTLLDPGFNPVIQELTEDNFVPTEFDDRPKNYTGSDVMKVIILMTDGYNTTNYRVNDPYRFGFSNIHWFETENKYSTQNDDPDSAYYEQYYWHDVQLLEDPDSRGRRWVRDEWQDHPFGSGQYTVYRCTSWTTSGSTEICTSRNEDRTRIRSEKVSSSDPDPRHLEWHDVWESTGSEVVRELYAEWMGDAQADVWHAGVTEPYARAEKDPRVRSLCAAAKEENIIIFSVAFEAPSAGKSILWDCKTSVGTYYEANGTEIISVFDSIGSTIRNLRLTQ